MARNTGPPTREQMLFVQGIYERYRGALYKFAVARTRDPAEADDAVSETLLRLFRNAETLQGLHEREILDYAVQTVMSVTGDFGRRQRAERKHVHSIEEEDYDPGELEPDPETRYVERETELEERRRLHETLAELRDTDRYLLVGKYMEELSDEVLARQLGVKASSIRMKLTRARKRALKILRRKEAEADG